MSDYQIIFSDKGDYIYLDELGNLCFREGGGEEITICTAKNTPALIKFLQRELDRSTFANSDAAE